MVGNQSVLRVAAVALLAMSTFVAAGSTHVNVGKEIQVDVDLHALCESLARDCWDLDPDDFGMTPVNSYVVPPDGALAGADWEEGVKLGTKLLGKNVHAHAGAEASANVSHTGDEEQQGQVPCGDDPLCPDLIVDGKFMAITASVQERDFSETHCAVQEGSTEPGTRRLLRFTFVSPNVGAGDLQIGDPDQQTQWFEWGTCHGHWHFKEYADYRLWDVAGYAAWQAVRAAHPTASPAEVFAAYPELQEHFLSGHKQGFCVIDISPWGSPVAGVVTLRQFDSCADNQGITSFWADEYRLFLDGQWVDVTGLASGAYVLEAEVNPERFYVESDYANNAAAVVVNVP